MASQLTTPDMSALPTLLPGRETTINVPAGQRILVAVPDPSRTSLVISSSGTGALTLSTRATGTMAEGMQFPGGLAGPYLITWDLYGSKVQDAWYAGNPGAGAIDVTVIEVMSRPDMKPTARKAAKSATPLSDCLKRRPQPVFEMPTFVIEQPTPIPSPCGGPNVPSIMHVDFSGGTGPFIDLNGLSFTLHHTGAHWDFNAAQNPAVSRWTIDMECIGNPKWTIDVIDLTGGGGTITGDSLVATVNPVDATGVAIGPFGSVDWHFRE